MIWNWDLRIDASKARRMSLWMKSYMPVNIYVRLEQAYGFVDEENLLIVIIKQKALNL